MHLFSKRIFMVEAGEGGGGNGAPVVPAAAVIPAEPAAQQPAAPQALDVKSIADSVRDSLFAELRKAGVFEKKSASPAPKAGEPAPTPIAADPIKLRSLDRALSKNGLAASLSDSQYQRAEKAFTAEDPSDVEGWVKDYFTGFGASPLPAPNPAAPVAATPAAPAPQNATPASNRGAPPAPQVPLEEINLWTAGQADRDAYIKSKGLKAYTAKLREQGKGVRVSR